MSDLDFTDLEDFEFHYVVRFDPKVKKFVIDVDTTIAKFESDGQVYTGSDWYDPNEGDDPRVHGLLYELEERLARLLDNCQEV